MVNLYFYRNGGFPPASKFLDKMSQSRAYRKHKKRLKNAKGSLDLTPPRDFAHLQLQVKRLQVEQDRQAEIDRQNLVIIDKLSEIKTSPARVDAWNKDWKPSNDRLRRFRDRSQRRIDQENKKMSERLKNAGSYYNHDDWEKDYQKHLYYLSMMENSTKDYDTIEDEDESDGFESDEDSLPPVPPGTPDKEKQKKKDSDSDDNVSLPPIEEKRTRAKKQEKYSEHEAIMDAEELKAAIDDNDKDKILEILGRTSEKDKLTKLEAKYKELYDKDLNEDLKSVIDEDTLKALESLSSDAAEKDAKKLYEATKGLGTDEDALIEILCTRTNKDLAAIRKAYKEKYKNTLEEDLRGDTSGDLETLLVELSKGNREVSKEVDRKMAKRDAKDLTEAGVSSWGTDEGVFIRVFTQRSHPQLAAMFPEYKKIAKDEIDESIDKEMDGDLQKAFLTLVKLARDPAAAQGEKLNQAIKDGDLETLARIILPMDKSQLNQLKLSYKKDNKTALADDIQKISDQGDLKALLLAKIGKGNKDQQDKGKKGEKKGKEKDKLPAINGEKGKPQKGDTKPADKKTDKTKDKESDKNKTKDSEKQAEEEAKRDADELHQAIEDANKDLIIDILARNCADKGKLQKLQDKFKEKHKQDLLEALQPHLDDDVRDPVESLFTPSSEYDAKCLYEAMKGLGTDEDLLIEVLCTHSNAELSDIKKVYQKKYDSTLEDDIKGDTSGDFEDLLVKLLQGTRDESKKINKDLAKKDAEALQQAGVKSFGTDEDKFVEILTQRSHEQLNATFVEYKKIQKVEIEESIDEEMDGDLGKGLLALVKCIRSASGFHTSKLQKALENGDTNTLARVILGSDKATIAELMSGYKEANKKNLEDEVEKKCSPNLNKLLQAKMGKGKTKQQNKGKQDPKNKGKPSDKRVSSPKNKKPGDAAPKNKKDNECSELHKAIEDEDKKKIKEIVVKAATDKTKLKKLSDDYKKQHKQNLVEVLDGKLDEDIHEAVVAMLLPANEADARTLYHAMKGAGTKEAQLIEILCTRNNAEIAAIKKQYEKKYGRSLEEDIKGETSGDFEDLLVALMSGKRDESSEVNDDQAHKDAESLIEAGIKKWGTDEDQFIEIFTTRSLAQLQAMLPEYTEWAKCDIEDSINNEMEGDLRDGLLVLVKCIRGVNEMSAGKLHTALQDGDTAAVARIIAGSDEGTLSKMESAYNSTNKPKLYFDVDKKCSNDLKKILLPKLKGRRRTKRPSGLVLPPIHRR